MNVIVIGNCQASGLSRALNRTSSVNVAATLDTNSHAVQKPDFVEKVFGNISDIDVILTQPISDKFPHIATSRLRSEFGEKVVTYTNIFFSGLHPDLCYFGTFGARLSSPFGNYHSRICLISYLNGIDIASCIKAFNAKTYEELGYYSAYDTSLVELERRDRQNVISMFESFRDTTTRQLTMLSVNHPTSVIFKTLANKVLEHTGIKGEAIFSDGFVNILSDSAIWPVYPELRDYHHIKYDTPQLFIPNSSAKERAMGLEQFVANSYKRYDEVGVEALRNMPGAVALQEKTIW